MIYHAKCLLSILLWQWEVLLLWQCLVLFVMKSVIVSLTPPVPHHYADNSNTGLVTVAALHRTCGKAQRSLRTHYNLCVLGAPEILVPVFEVLFFDVWPKNTDSQKTNLQTQRHFSLTWDSFTILLLFEDIFTPCLKSYLQHRLGVQCARS